MKILFAEDDLISYKILENIFNRWNYDSIGVKNGTAAMELLKTDKEIKIALLDWMMPGMSGLEICKKISNSFRDYIHVILVTTLSDNESIVAGLEAGASDYIAKPYDPRILKARIDAAIRIIEMNQKLAEYGLQMETLANERARQIVHSDRLATIGRLSSGIAHEINNPASFISVNIQLLEENWSKIEKVIDDAPESGEKTVAREISRAMPGIFSDMKSGVRRITSIVESLKRYYQSDRSEKKSPARLEKIIDEALKMCRNKLKSDVEVVKHFRPGLPEIKVNAREIEQVFVNLIINAADAMKNSKEKILTIDLHREENHISVTVSDTGPGIPDEILGKVFDPFFTTKGIEEGTGMGLSISKNIVTNHKGEIIARNKKNKGMDFIVRLPF